MTDTQWTNDFGKVPILKTKVILEDKKKGTQKAIGYYRVLLPFEAAWDEGLARKIVLDKVRAIFGPNVINTWVHTDIVMEPDWRVKAWMRLPFKESRLIR